MSSGNYYPSNFVAHQMNANKWSKQMFGCEKETHSRFERIVMCIP